MSKTRPRTRALTARASDDAAPPDVEVWRPPRKRRAPSAQTVLVEMTKQEYDLYFKWKKLVQEMNA